MSSKLSTARGPLNTPNPQDGMRAWSCRRCARVPGFQPAVVHFDADWDLLGYAGYLPSLNAKVVAFRGSDAGSWANWANNMRGGRGAAAVQRGLGWGWIVWGADELGWVGWRDVLPMRCNAWRQLWDVRRQHSIACCSMQPPSGLQAALRSWPHLLPSRTLPDRLPPSQPPPSPPPPSLRIQNPQTQPGAPMRPTPCPASPAPCASTAASTSSGTAAAWPGPSQLRTPASWPPTPMAPPTCWATAWVAPSPSSAPWTCVLRSTRQI